MVRSLFCLFPLCSERRWCGHMGSYYDPSTSRLTAFWGGTRPPQQGVPTKDIPTKTRPSNQNERSRWVSFVFVHYLEHLETSCTNKPDATLERGRGNLQYRVEGARTPVHTHTHSTHAHAHADTTEIVPAVPWDSPTRTRLQIVVHAWATTRRRG